MAKIAKKSRFWLGYIILIGVLVIFMVVVFIYVWNTMKKYEASQPKYTIEGIIEKIQTGTLDIPVTGGVTKTSGKFEKGETGTTSFDFNTMFKGKTLTYQKDKESYNQDKPIYDIIENNKVIAKVKLSAVNTHNVMAILAISDWDVTEITANMAMQETGNINVSVTMPSNFSATLNGIALSDTERKGEPQAKKEMENVGQYAEVPKFVTYEVTGLSKAPVLSIKDNNNAEVDLSSYNGDYSNVSVDYKPSEMPQDLKDYVLLAAKTYSNYFSRDVEGCQSSTAGIQPFFPKDSYFVQLAEQYRQGDMWMFSGHTAPTFSNESVTDYIRYSDTVFACTVAFDKTMVLKNGTTRVDKNNQVYYYVNIDGKWLIADMRENK